MLPYNKYKLLLLLSVIIQIISFSVNKQLADKERVAAALENNHLLEVVNQCLVTRAEA